MFLQVYILHEFNMIYFWRGCCFHSEVVFTLFFWYEVEFLLSCWLRQCWSIWHVNILYCSFLFRKDWLILNQTKCSLTNKIFDEQMCTQAKHMSLTVSIKFISGKIWVFTPLKHFWPRITLLTYILKRYNQYFFQLTYLQPKFSSFIYSIPLI